VRANEQLDGAEELGVGERALLARPWMW